MVAQRAEPKAKKRGICRTTGWQPTIFWGDKCTVRFACIITYVKHLTFELRNLISEKNRVPLDLAKDLAKRHFYLSAILKTFSQYSFATFSSEKTFECIYSSDFMSHVSNIWQWAWSLKVFFVNAHNSEPNTPCTHELFKEQMSWPLIRPVTPQWSHTLLSNG